MDPVTLTAVIEKDPDDELYSSLCPELGIASCGATEAEALEMLQEAVAGYLELAPDALDKVRATEVKHATTFEVRRAA